MLKAILILLLLLNLPFQSIKAQDSPVINHFFKGIKITDIASDGNSLWLSTEGNGIFRFNTKNKAVNNYSVRRKNLQHDFFYCLAISPNYVWAGSTDGLFIFNKKRNRWSKRKFSKGGQLSNWIRSIEYDKSSKIVWIGRFMFLTKFDIKTRRFKDYDLTVHKNEKSNTIKMIKVEGDSIVWFGTEAGLHKYKKNYRFEEPGAITFYNNSRNYFNREGETISISDMIFEGNNLWIGLDEFITKERPKYNIGGIYIYDRENEWIRLDESNGLNANGIFSMERTGKYIWVSMYQFSQNMKIPYGRGLVLIDISTKEVTPIFDPNIPDTIYKIFFDGEFIWLGTKNGLIQIKLQNQLSKFSRM